MTGCYDIRDAFTQELGEELVRVTFLFDCYDNAGYSMTVEKQSTVFADGSDVENTAKTHIELLKEYRNLTAVYKGMAPK